MRRFLLPVFVFAALPASAADLAADTRALHEGIVQAEQALAAGMAELTANTVTNEVLADKIASTMLPALTLAIETWSAAADKISTDTESPDRAPYEACSLAAGDMKNALSSRERWLRGGGDIEAETFDMYMQSFGLMKADCETALGIVPE